MQKLQNLSREADKRKYDRKQVMREVNEPTRQEKLRGSLARTWLSLT